jgi:methionyl-tRNA formyltransferase
MMRLVFFGTNTESLPALHALLQATDTVEVLAVVTGMPKQQGRAHTLTPTPVDSAAQHAGIPVRYFEDPSTLTSLKEARATFHIVVSFGAILKPEWLGLPERGTINIHPSLLPAWRGPTPVQASIRNADLETGVSIMLMDEKMDHGPILWQSAPRALHEGDRTPALLAELMEQGAQALVPTLAAFLKGDITPREQAHEQATFCRLLSRTDGFLAPGVWGWTADRLFRAFHPWPGMWCLIEHRGQPVRVKILDWEFLLDGNEKDAPINALQERDGHIFAGNSRIITWQWEGKPASNASAFAAAHKGWSVDLIHHHIPKE